MRERLEWFRDLKFGILLTWGPYSQWGTEEAWPLVENAYWSRDDSVAAWVERGKDLAWFRRDYWELPKTFNPVRFAPREWARVARKAGFRYMVLTTKHCDGFCLFDTRTTDYRITSPEVPFHVNAQSNVVREVFRAFRREGLAVGAYLAKADWRSTNYWKPGRPTPNERVNFDTVAEPESWGRYVDLVHRQVEELTTGYGRIDLLWLDCGWVVGPSEDLQMDRLVVMARRDQPGLIVVNRGSRDRHEPIRTPEQWVPPSADTEPWESVLTVGGHWTYNTNDVYRSGHALVHLLVDVVGKGGNLLLGLGPRPEGDLAPEAVSRLLEVGDWLEVNGEAIYGTRALAPFRVGPLAFTRRNSTGYVICTVATSEDGPPPRITWSTPAPAAGSPIRLVGSPVDLDWSTDAGGVTTVEIPAEVRRSPPCKSAFALRFRLP